VNVKIEEILCFLSENVFEHEFSGDSSFFIKGFCPLSDLKPGCITWIKNINTFDLSAIKEPADYLIITARPPSETNISGLNLIITSNPKAIYFEILKKFFPPKKVKTGIASSSIVESSNIGQNVTIGHNCYICEDAVIGDNVTIKHNVIIDCPVTIGNDCFIESGVVIGAIGYGYYTIGDKKPKKVPDYGGVKIGNRVDIGANAIISMGTLSDTIIEDDAKIDGFSYISHNVRIGARSYVIANWIGGSSKIEEDACLATGAIVMKGTTVGRNSMVGVGAVVMKDIDANRIAVSMPARVIKENPEE